MTCLTNVGYADGECIRATAARNIALARLAGLTLIAIDNANQAMDNFRKQWKIAKRGLAMAQEAQGHLETTYWPREIEAVNEFGPAGGAHDGVESIESVEVMGRRYSGRLVAAVTNRFAKQLDGLRASFSRYNTSANRKALQDLLMMRAQTIAAARVLGRNIAWAETMAREENDWNRRQAAIVMAKGLMGRAEALMMSAGGLYGKVGQQALDGLNNAMRGMGDAFQTVHSNENIIKGNYFNPFPEQAGPVKRDPSENPWATHKPSEGVPEYSPARAVGMQSTLSDMGSPANANSVIDNSGYGAQDKWNGALQTGQNTANWTGADMQMAHGVVGTSDLVRTGSYTFPVSGGSGSVTIDMDKFKFAYADGQTSDTLANKPTGV